MTAQILCGVVTVSDRCYRGEETDRSGPLLRGGLLAAGYHCQDVTIVPDDVEKIRQAITASIAAGARVVLVAGGTGVSPGDVTPEAAEPFIEVPLPGLTQLLFQASLQETPYAALSRGAAGLTASEPRCLIVTLAGSVNAATTAVNCLTPLISHLFSQLDRDRSPKGPYVEH